MRVKSFFSVAAVITYYYIVCTRWKSVGIKCVGEVELRGQYAVRCLKLRVGLMVQCLLSRLRVIFERYRKISVSDVRIVQILLYRFIQLLAGIGLYSDEGQTIAGKIESVRCREIVTHRTVVISHI